MSHLVAICSLLFLVACHDSERSNPVDPELTPAVQLQVSVDDTSGAAIVSWTRYAGDQPFGEYRVLRTSGDSQIADTLAVIDDANQLSYLDTSVVVGVSYEYQVSVVNAGGYGVPTRVEESSRLNLVPVEIVDVAFESATASATIEWTPYAGPRFAGYELSRRTAGIEPVVVASIPDIATTSFVDTSLHGNIEYIYRLVVKTTRAESVPGTEVRVTSFHALTATWPLDIADGDFVRLYREQPDRITALVSSPDSIRVVHFDPDGTLIEEQLLLELPFIEDTGIGEPFEVFDPRSADTAPLPEGGRALSLINRQRDPRNNSKEERIPWLMTFAPDGEPMRRNVVSITREDIVEQLDGDQLELFETWRLDLYDLVLVQVGIVGDEIVVENGGEALEFVNLVESFYKPHVVSLEHTPRADFMMFVSTPGRIRVTMDTVWGREDAEQSSLCAWYDGDPGQSALCAVMGFTRGSDLDRRPAVWVHSADHLPESWQFRGPDIAKIVGAPYRVGLSLNAAEDGIEGWIDSPVLWKGEDTESPWATVSVGPAELAVTDADQSIGITPAGEETGIWTLDVPASQVRSWTTEERSIRWTGVCLPLASKILVRPGPPQADWDFATSTIGGETGTGDGQLIFPLSFDVGANGDFYVLDAGNSRIQRFDAEGKYLTQWGRRGDEPGAFEFIGRNSTPEEVSGNIVLDEEGYIYVADVGNKRIQKFAP